MGKYRSSQKQRISGKGQTLAPGSFPEKVQSLLEQQKYRQALEEIKKARRLSPEIEFTPSEAEIWYLRGQQEFQKDDFKQAESSWHHSLELGLNGKTHYWLARCLLALNRLDGALALLQDAFVGGSLPKEYSICYLKLLFLKGDTATVEQLVSQQPKRFSAAQLHWVRGVLSLKGGQPETALACFQKIKRPVTPGDIPAAWTAYTQQAINNWDAAAGILQMESSQRRLSLGPKLEHPILERLATFQRAKTGQPPLNPTDLERSDLASPEAVMALAVWQLIDQGNHHDAGHVLLNIGHRSTHFPELARLRPALLALAGEQSLLQGKPECAETFWQPLMALQPFNLQLAVNLLEVLELNESFQERQRLLTRLLNWLEQEAKQHPQAWTDERLKLTLAYVHCRLADTWMALGRYRTALGSLQQAQRVCPESPEVIGRRGLVAANEEKYQEATVLLTQALAGGCRYEEVYDGLLNSWKELGNPQALNEARRRFGKYFDDLGAEAEIAISPWMDALSTRSYPLFSRLVKTKEQEDPALRACQIFVDAVQGVPNSSRRVSLQQSEAIRQWDACLEKLSAVEQISVLQAIALSIQLFAKREKGIAALINRYLQQLLQLTTQYPEAREAYLVVLAVKESNPQKLQTPLRLYLNTMPQPGNALANLQLQVRRFAWTRSLAAVIEETLAREPHNPLLLLAKATTYPTMLPQYEEFRQQGFELARRLQDAKALQAFREEQAFIKAQQIKEILPNPEEFDTFDPENIESWLEATLRKMFNNQIPQAELEQMLPELKQRMLGSMLDGNDDDAAPVDSGKRRKRQRGFQDL